MKAVEVELTDGRTVTLHEITLAEFGLFLAALPALQKIGEAFAAAGGDLSQLHFDVEAETLLPMWRLIAHCCDEQLEYLLGLSFMDGMVLFASMGELLPKNFIGRKQALDSPAT